MSSPYLLHKIRPGNKPAEAFSDLSKLFASDPAAARAELTCDKDEFQFSFLQNAVMKDTSLSNLKLMISVARSDNSSATLKKILSAENALGSRALHLAAMYSDNVELVQLLIRLAPEALIETNKRGSDPVFLCGQWKTDRSNFGSIQRLLEKAKNRCGGRHCARAVVRH
jgi:hypothetical protein